MMNSSNSNTTTVALITPPLHSDVMRWIVQHSGNQPIDVWCFELVNRMWRDSNRKWRRSIVCTKDITFPFDVAARYPNLQSFTGYLNNLKWFNPTVTCKLLHLELSCALSRQIHLNIYVMIKDYIRVGLGDKLDARFGKLGTTDNTITIKDGIIGLLDPFQCSDYIIFIGQRAKIMTDNFGVRLSERIDTMIYDVNMAYSWFDPVNFRSLVSCPADHVELRANVDFLGGLMCHVVLNNLTLPSKIKLIQKPQMIPFSKEMMRLPGLSDLQVIYQDTDSTVLSDFDEDVIQHLNVGGMMGQQVRSVKSGMGPWVSLSGGDKVQMPMSPPRLADFDDDEGNIIIDDGSGYLDGGLINLPPLEDSEYTKVDEVD